jgi:hypothetical protein
MEIAIEGFERYSTPPKIDTEKSGKLKNVT